MQFTSVAVRAGRLLYSHHANERLRERSIVKPEVEHILTKGHHEARKDKFNENFGSWDYAIRGKAIDGRNLRVVVAVVDPNILVVTAIDLDREE